MHGGEYVRCSDKVMRLKVESSLAVKCPSPFINIRYCRVSSGNHAMIAVKLAKIAEGRYKL